MQSLNHIYRTIWSEALGAWIAVSEITKAKGKRSGSCVLRALRIGRVSEEIDDTHAHRFKLIVVALACCFAVNAQANPAGGTVVNGNASFSNSGNTLTVTNTPGTIINWQNFSIGRNETTRFVQQSAASTVLNRVVTNNPSIILGTLSSNGQVYLVNANGIIFGAGSTVDVAGMVATTLNLSNADFKAGRHNYNGAAGAGSISNAGNIDAQQGGQIYLIAPDVKNTGIITAPGGEVLLAAGHSVDIVNSNDPALRVRISSGGTTTNLGQLISESGTLGLFGAVVKNSGNINADSAVMQGGKIVLKASRRVEAGGTISASGTTGGEIKALADMKTGTVDVSGELAATASGTGDGGFVDTSAAHVRVADTARVNTLAANGNAGTWLIDPTDYYVSATNPGGGVSWMSNTTLATNLGLGNITIQTLATGAGNGDIFVNDAVGWNSIYSLTLNAHRNINVNALISNTGSGGLTARADLNGTGTGTIIFGGGGSVSLAAGGTANLYYNPTTFGTPNGYTGNVTGGTLTEWMLVNNVTNLQAINTNLSGNYALGTNIDATGGFTALGTFIGRFDGQSHTISNLTIAGAGLFSTVGAGGQVANVGLVNSSVSASSSSVGALAGSNAGTISNSYVSNGTVTVTGAFWGVGGLVGSNSGTITDSHVSGSNVSGQYGHIGGLVGTNASAISSSYVDNVSVVNSASFATSAGGLVGNNAGAISNSYVTGGSVTSVAAGPVGGLVGHSTGTIANSYASNASLSSAGLRGGLVGELWGGSISNSFWDTDTTGVLVAAGMNTGGLLVNVTGLTTVSTMSSGTVSGYLDTATVWWMSDTNTRPFLRSEWSTTITNAHELQLMELDTAAAYKQANNIDMTTALAAGGMWGSAGFKPVGDNMVLPYSFTGSYDGGGYTITGLSINRAASSYIGLFGMTNGASISNVGLVNASVTGANWVGGLVGYSSTSTIIDNCYVDNGAISGQSNVGGLLGYANSNTVSNSYVQAGTVSGTWSVGGMAGSSYNTVFSSDHANSNVTGTNYVGGLLGNLGALSSLNNSYVDGGALSGSTFVGGLVGAAFNLGAAFNPSTISNSHYNINAVTINGANAVTFGGLYNDSTANFNGVGQFTDWLSHGMTLDIANYTSPYGSFGTAGVNSYTIGTAQGMKDMLGFADNAAYTFTLTSNITLANGVYVPYLAASFDGAGFTVSGLNLNQGYASRLGLFGHVAAGTTVSNVFLSNASVAGLDEVGALAGLNEGTISGSHSIGGAVSGASSVGGLIGHSLQGDIQNSYVSGGTVNGASFVGGLVGQNTGSATISGSTILSGFITNSYVDGGIVVAGTGNSVGGLVGQSRSAQIDGSHATLADGAGDSVTGNLRVGGLVGMNGGSMDTSSSIITNSWVDVVTSGTVSGTDYVGGLVGFDSGEGVLTNNTVSGITVNGDSYVGGLAGIMASAPFANPGYASNNDVLNSFVNGGVVTGGAYVGGLAGWSGKAVSSGTVSGTAVSGARYVGGLVGGSIGDINLSYVYASSVVGSDNIGVGGLAGSNSGFIAESFVLGTTISGGPSVLGTSGLGGLVGHNSGSISNTYISGGTVSGLNNVGGLVGTNNPGGTISFSYVDTGAVTGTTNVGGVVGINYNPAGGVTDTYWNSALVGGALAGGIALMPNGGTDTAVALTTTQMQQMSSFTGWSIANTGGAGMTWRIYDGHTGPMLTFLLTQASVTANDATITYDGTNFSGGNGVTPSVVAANGGSVLGTFGGTSQGARNAGTYVIDANGLYSDQFGYDITGYTNGTLTINQATLTLNAATDTKVYDGTTTSGGVVGVAGLGAGDTVTGATQSFGSKNVLGTNGSTLVVDAGYVVNDGNGGNNYIVVTNNATGTVTAATLNIDAVSDSKVYDGTTASAGAVTVSGLVGGDTVTGATQSFGSRNVLGANGSTLSVTGYTVNDGNGGANYTVASNTATGTITPAAMTVTANDVSKYEGTADPALTYTVGGLQTGDTAASTLSGLLARDAGELVGAYNINQGTLGLTTSNYTLTYVPGTFSIVEPPLITQSLLAALVKEMLIDISDMPEKKHGSKPGMQRTLADGAGGNEGGDQGNLPATVCK